MNILLYRTVSSTQDIAREKVLSGQFLPQEWTWIIAQRQRHGYGQRGAVWVCEKGNVYTTVIVPMKHAVPTEALAMVAAYCVHQMCASYGMDTHIKWMNDVFYDKKKLAGVLVENMGNNHGQCVLLMGFGINVTSCPEGASCLRQYIDPCPDVLSVVNRLHQCLYKQMQIYCAHGFAPFVQKISACLLWRGKKVRVDQTTGTLLGISPTGGILLDTGPKEGFFKGQCRLFSEDSHIF